MKKLIIPGIILLGLAISCKKDKKTTTPPPTTPTDTTYSKYTALTTDKWKITNVYVTAPSTGDTTIFYYDDLMKACEKDNFYSFTTTATIAVNEGDTKCDVGAPQDTTDGKWALSSDTTQFSIEDSKILPFTGTVVLKVERLTKTELRLTKDTSGNISGIPFTGTIHAHFAKVK